VTLADGHDRALPSGVRPGEGVPRALRPEDDRGDDLGAGAAVETLARHFAKEPGTTLFAIGMGPNQFFNSDNKDRAVFLLAALTGNVGKIGGNVGSYAGNYRTALFNGSPQWINENPFDIELDPTKSARPSSTGRRSRRTTTTTKTIRCASARSCSPARRTCRRRPSRCGSRTRTRSSATSSGTTTRWSTCCRASR
jgi:hypothetical protein